MTKHTLSIKELIKTSRIISWPNTAVPFIVGYIAATGRIDLPGIAGLLYFCFSYNLLMYGVNDIFDYESDIKNPRKNSIEGGLLPKQLHGKLWQAIAIANIPFLAYFLYVGTITSHLILAALIFFCLSYSIKGLRFKEVPFLDSLNSALHFVMPYIFGVSIGGGQNFRILAALGFLCWGMASQAFGAIQDIGPDREANIKSIATAIGAKRTTQYSFWLYVACISLIILSFGTKGILASILLSAYPLNVAFFMKYKSDAQSARFRRGWRNFIWLNFLVGFGLTQILLWRWDPFSLGGSKIGYIFISLTIIGLIQLALVLHNFAGFRRPKTGRLEEWPKISILIHAFNQADNINSTLLSLIGQNYPSFEIIFTDLGSTDNTLKIAQSYNDKKLTIIDTDEVPSGWTLESWAAQQLLNNASGKIALSLAADTVLLPNALTTIASLLSEQKLDLAALLPADQDKSLAQKTILSHNHYFMFGMYPAAYLDKNNPSLTSVYSQVVAFDIDAIQSLGGYELTKRSPLNDLDLPIQARKHRAKTAFYLGSDIAMSQNHASWRLIGRQNIQQFYPALHFNMPLSLSLFAGGLFISLGLIYGIIGSIGGSVSIGLFGLAYAANLLPRLLVARESKQNIIATIVFPITSTVALAVLPLSMIGYEIFRPRWQSRTEATV